jgi:hypothetical protein
VDKNEIFGGRKETWGCKNNYSEDYQFVKGL